MMTYLKHVGNFKHSELKIKKFGELQALYEKIKRSDEDFISIGSAEDERLIKKMNENGIDSFKNETGSRRRVKKKSRRRIKEEESTKKRKLGTRKKMKSRKEDHTKSSGMLIKEWKKQSVFGKLNHRDDDLNAVYQLVIDRYQDEIPKGFDRVLWGDLMVMFNPDDEDKFWNSQGIGIYIHSQNRRFKFLYSCAFLVDFADMALSPHEQRHRFLRYEGLKYTDSNIADFESRMAMEHRGEAGVVVFTSQAWGRLFGTMESIPWRTYCS
ncbi:hypothetical protein Tco_1475446 [Tanacetum coccineum]